MIATPELPHDRQVELALLDCLLSKPELLRMSDLDLEAFYVPLHKTIYRTMLELDSEGCPCDRPFVLSKVLERAGADRAAEIARIADVGAVASSFNAYIDRLKRVAYQRELVKIEEHILRLTYTCHPDHVEAERERLVRKARERFWPPEVGLEPEEAVAKLREFYQKTADWSVGTGWPAVDLVIGQVHPGSVITALARTGVGKSALGLNLTVNWLRTEAEWGVMFASLEMEGSLATDRMVRICEGWTQRQVMAAMKTGSEPMNYQRITSNRFCLFSQARQPLSVIERSIDLWQKRHGKRIRALVIDYFQYLAGERGESPYERSSRLSRELKELAKIRELMILNLCQVGRGESGGQGNRCPSLDGARDSGTIEENADIVLGLWRPKDRTNSLLLKVLKARSGPDGGQAELAFEPDTMRLVDPGERSATNGARS